MEYYIDGHNLIPKVNGIRLSDDNDEEEDEGEITVPGAGKVIHEKLLIHTETI